MNLFNFPVRRPVTVAMSMIMVLILGLLSLNKMPLDLMPEINFPNLVVFVRYEGAGPEEVEERLAKPLEAAIKATTNLKNIKVTAQEEMAFVVAEFNWGTDLDSASADLREKIAMVRDILPSDIDEPVVLRINFQDFPVMFLHVDDPSGRRNLADLADIARDQVAPQLERLPGVASAATMGGLIREIQVNVDRDKIVKYGLSYTDIMNAIAYRNLDATTGHIDFSGMRFRVRGKSQFQSLEDLENIPIGNGMTQSQRSQQAMMALVPYKDLIAGQGSVSPVRLRDVADVVDTFKERRGLVRIIDRKRGATEGVGMAVLKETDANMVEVAKTVTKALSGIRDTLPAGVNVEVSFDLSEIITDSISALSRSALEGGILAALVILIFLWRLRPSLIVITSIPLSFLAAFIAMYFSGYTLNIMTLGAMVIAVGKLVDDSIVVMENIYRHLGQGESPAVASEQGFREVATAVISATLVAVIIFLPVAFTQGLSAQMFRTFAGTVFFALMASLAVSFTVVPMLTSQVMKPESRERMKARRGVFAPIQNAYARLLAWSLDNWGKVLSLAMVISVMTVAMIVLMYARGRFEFIPRLVGGMYRAQVVLPPGSLMDQTDTVMKKITDILMKEVPDFHNFFMVVGESGDPSRAAFMGGEQGMNRSEMNIKMWKKSEGRTTTDEKLRKLWDDFAKTKPNVDISFMQAGSMDFSSEKPVIIKVYGDDFGVLRRISDQLAEQVKEVQGTRDVTTSLQQGVPEYSYRFNRDRLFSFGMPSVLALMQVKAAVGGEMASIYREAGKEYDITVQLKESQQENFNDIGDIPLASPLGFHVPVRDVASFEFSEGPSEIKRENSKRVVTVEANKTEDSSLGKISQDIKAIIAKTKLPEGYGVEFGGEVEDLQDAFIDLGMMFGAAIILVYLILASLYESIIHPITIMIAIPLAFTGAVAGLFITNTAFGVTAFIGMIMLVGIVATNSIVLMDFILEFHHQGIPRREAIIEAGRTRLRPILMTALTTLFGVLPIALGRAEGMELQQPLGIVMVGGLISSTMLTLVIIPVMYDLFEDFREDMAKLFRRGRAETEPPPLSPPGGDAA